MGTVSAMPVGGGAANGAASTVAADLAAEQLDRRASLRGLVQEWWLENGWGSPSLPDAAMPAALGRQLCSFRYEDAVFATMSQAAGLTPVWFSYNGDRMSTESKLKRSYLRPLFCSGQGRKGGLKLRPVQLASMSDAFARPLDQIRTTEGIGLVEYHRAHQESMFPGAARVDNTAWLKRIGGARNYYAAYLSIFVAHAILLEDYYGGESGNVLGPFTLRIFEPAFAEVTRLFGAKPLIVPLPWWPEMRYYPADQHWRDHGVRIVP